MNRFRQVGAWVLLHRAGLVLVASLLALVFAAYSGYKSRESAEGQRRFIACQAEYNQINNERTRALLDAADQERAAERRSDAAERNLFTSPILSKPAGQRSTTEQAQIDGLFAEYQAALNVLEQERADADKARQEHPVPDPPDEACG